MAITLTITKAGRAALINAQQTGTEKRTIVSAGVTPTPFNVDDEITTLPNEYKRINAVSGAAIAPDMISVSMLDSSTDAYSVAGFGLYLDDGTLFAVYSQNRSFLDKTEFSYGLIQGDVLIKDASIKAEDILFGDFVFINPVATTTTDGISRLATLDEALAMKEKGAVLINPHLLKEAINSLIATDDDINNGVLGKLISSGSLQALMPKIGTIELSAFRVSELEKGWYHANGDRFSVTSNVGIALLALSASYKADFNITENAGLINLPSLYHEDGRAYFMRAGREVGLKLGDAIRNISGTFMVGTYGDGTPTGAFKLLNYLNSKPNAGATATPNIQFNASNVVPTAGENRPISMSFVPTVYLGV